FTAQQLNYLIYRYLEESGFRLTTLAFKTETQIDKLEINTEEVERGALVTYILKGLQYRDIELHTNSDGTSIKCDVTVPLIGKHTCKISTVSEPQVIIASHSDSYRTNEVNQNLNDDNIDKDKSQKDSTKNPFSRKQIRSNKNPNASPKFAKFSQEELNKNASPTSKRSVTRRSSTSRTKKNQDPVSALQDSININNEISIMKHSTNEIITTSSSTEYVTLEGHTGEVYFCKWHPDDPNVLATAGQDSVLRIWKPDPNHQDKFIEAFQMVNEELGSNNFICSMDWRPTGKLLATSYFNGVPRIWTDQGCLKTKLDSHNKKPVTKVKWNPSGSLILTAGYDKMIILWEVNSTTAKQSYLHHNEVVTDLDWKNDTIFASCSYDKSIFIYDTTKKNPITQYPHDDKIFCLAWDPSKNYLASGSADTTVKIWADDEKKLHRVLKHQREVDILCWSPSISNIKLLATSTKDKQISIWNADSGECLHTANQLSKPIKYISWRPDGEWIAYGSTDSVVRFLSIKDDIITLKKSYSAPFAIIGLDWNSDKSKIAASL
ncbi:8250_t:CDS:10, partial [Entrophospora sp. SA101]